MEKFRRGPSTVVVVGDDASLRESVVAAVDRRSFPSRVTDPVVRGAESTDHDPPVRAVACSACDEALDRLESDESVGCVVLDDSLAESSVSDCVATLVDECPDLPVVVYAADGDERLASATTRAGAFAYLPRPPDGLGPVDHDDLLDTVSGALTVHDRRFRAAAQSDVLDTMFSELEVSMYVKDDEARHLKIADALGAPSPTESIGKTDWELYSWDEESKLEALGDDRLVIDEGEPIYEREERHGPPEASRWLKTTKVPWRDGDEVRGLVGITQDVSEEKRQMRDLRAQKRRLDDFATFVARDLRNPLHVAMAYHEFAREGDEEAAEKVADALDRMEELIEDLSDLAASGATAPAPVGGVEFPSFLQVVWDEVATATATLDLSMPPETTLYTNRLQLKPLFENLFENSVEHAGPEVTVRVGLTGDGFYVEDDGPGIPDAERERLREDGSHPTSTGGGTGLAIASEIADTHGWDFRICEGDRSSGARFEFGNVLLVADPDRVPEHGVSHPLTTGGDVGDALNTGESSHDEALGRWTLRAAGDNLLEHTDEFHFRWVSLQGDCRIEARVVEFDAPINWSKAGVMIRDAPTERSTFGHVGVAGNGRTELLWRTEDGEPARRQLIESGERSFEWFALERTGDRVTAFVSTDGEEWHAVDQRPVALDDRVCVGLVACSATIGAYCEATFERVTAATFDDAQGDS